MVAYIMGQVLGRGLAWLHVYSEPRKTRIILFESDSEHQGNSDQRRSKRQKEAVKQRII
jgi:hypothetical protein